MQYCGELVVILRCDVTVCVLRLQTRRRSRSWRPEPRGQAVRAPSMQRPRAQHRERHPPPPQHYHHPVTGAAPAAGVDAGEGGGSADVGNFLKFYNIIIEC